MAAQPPRPSPKPWQEAQTLSLREKLRLHELRSRRLKEKAQGRIQAVRATGKPAARQSTSQGIREKLKTLVLRRRGAMGSRSVFAPSPAPDTAPELPPGDPLWLSTEGNYIVDENGYAINLRGASVIALDTVAPASDQTVAEALSLDDANLSVMTELWEMNVVRVPFHAQTILEGNDSLYPDEILAGIDDIVNSVAGYNAYTLLALQAPEVNGAAAIPDQSVFECWQLLASRYQSAQAVLYEIYSASLPIAGDWINTAPILIGAIRKENPASLLFVGNGGVGANIAGLPLRFTNGEPIFNLVYTIRVSPQPIQASFDAAFQGFADLYPIFVSDWAVSGPDLERTQELTAGVFESYGLGWAASNWNAGPRLVANSAAHDFTLTRSGSVVRRAMALPTKLRFPPYLRGFNSLEDFSGSDS